MIIKAGCYDFEILICALLCCGLVMQNYINFRIRIENIFTIVPCLSLDIGIRIFISK